LRPFGSVRSATAAHFPISYKFHSTCVQLVKFLVFVCYYGLSKKNFYYPLHLARSWKSSGPSKINDAFKAICHKSAKHNHIIFLVISVIGFGGLGVPCWPLVPTFAGSNPAEVFGFLGLYFPSFEGEVKPSVPCRRFAACKRSLNLCGSRNLGKITTGHLSRPQFSCRCGRRHLAAKMGTVNAGVKQWQLPPRACPGCSVSVPYRSHDWALVPAKPEIQG